MKSVLITLLIIGSAITIYGQDSWVQMDSVNGPGRANAATFVLNDDGYVVAGYDGFNKKRFAVSYDVSQDDWDGEVSLGGASGGGLNRTSPISFEAYGFGFVGLGEGDGYMFSDLWQFDRFTDTWTQMADFTGGARTQAVAFSINDIGFVGLGKFNDYSTLMKDFWSYDYLLNSWVQISDFPGTARMDAIASRMGERGYVGLGYDGSSFPVDFYEYYPFDDTWAQKANFPGTPRINAVSFAIFPQFFVTTGDDGFAYLNDTWEYNYFGNVWTQKVDFPGPGRSGAVAFVIGYRCFVGTGFSAGIYHDDLYEYVYPLSTESTINVDLALYPNPVNDEFYFSLPGIENAKIKLFDVSGKEISASLQIENSGGGDYKVRVKQIESGNYYLLVLNENNVIANQKLVIIQ